MGVYFRFLGLGKGGGEIIWGKKYFYITFIYFRFVYFRLFFILVFGLEFRREVFLIIFF